MKKMRLLLGALALVGVLATSVMPVQAASSLDTESAIEAAESDVVDDTSGAVVAKGKCGKKITWKLTKKGVLKITGKGQMWDFTLDGSSPDNKIVPWLRHQGMIKKIVISDGIKNVGTFAFFECTNLKTVTFGKDIEHIGDYAFRGCMKLQNFKLPAGLKYIGTETFCYNQSITEVHIPNKIEMIGTQAFFGDIALTKVTIGGNKKVSCFAGMAPFDYCPALKQIKVSAKNTGLKSVDGVLYDKKVKTLIQYPGGKRTKKVTLPTTVRHIGDNAIEYAPYLQQMILPKKLKSIGSFNFFDCDSLKNLVIPAKVTSIGVQVGGWNENIAYIHNKSAVNMELPRVFGLIWINNATDKEQIEFISKGKAYLRAVIYDFTIEETMSLAVGETAKFNFWLDYGFQAYTNFRDDDFLYTSDNESVVTVGEDGTITAIAPGEAVITVTGRYVQADIAPVTRTCVITVTESDSNPDEMVVTIQSVQ